MHFLEAILPVIQRASLLLSYNHICIHSLIIMVTYTYTGNNITCDSYSVIPKLPKRRILCPYSKIVFNSKGMAILLVDIVGQFYSKQGRYT